MALAVVFVAGGEDGDGLVAELDVGEFEGVGVGVGGGDEGGVGGDRLTSSAEC